MLTPLRQFICDTCGEIINKPEEGWIEWISKLDPSDHSLDIHSFRIVHHYASSPLAKPNNDGCYQHSGKPGRADNHLHHFINDNYKMANILRMLDIGPYHNPEYKGTDISDMRQYVETVRRLTIPYYEEARLYWEDAKEDGYFNDCNEIWIYGVDTLKQLIEQYGEK